MGKFNKNKKRSKQITEAIRKDILSRGHTSLFDDLRILKTWRNTIRKLLDGRDKKFIKDLKLNV